MGAIVTTVPPRHDAEARLAWVEAVEARFAPIAAALGVLFIFVVIGENLATEGSALRGGFLAAGWAIWGVFVLEFAFRAVLAPSIGTFLKRNWWQLVFLALPFLRFIAVLRFARVARAGRIVSSAVRGTRSAGRVLRDRIAWLAIVHAIVVLAASQLLFEFGNAGTTYGEVLHAVALASVAGEPLGFDGGLTKVLDVVLALYAVVVFATAAATVGAYLLERRGAETVAER
jgi:voltage-gated potassium channel